MLDLNAADPVEDYLAAALRGYCPSPTIGPTAKDGWDWVAGVHERQLQRLAEKKRARSGDSPMIT